MPEGSFATVNEFPQFRISHVASSAGTRHQFDLDSELMRQKFFREDAELNSAIAAWEVQLSELLNEEWCAEWGRVALPAGGVTPRREEGGDTPLR